MMSWAWVTKQVLMMSAKLMHAIRGFTVFPDKYSNYQQPIARISVAAVDFYRLRAIALALRVLEAARYRACASRTAAIRNRGFHRVPQIGGEVLCAMSGISV